MGGYIFSTCSICSEYIYKLREMDGWSFVEDRAGRKCLLLDLFRQKQNLKYSPNTKHWDAGYPPGWMKQAEIHESGMGIYQEGEERMVEAEDKEVRTSCLGWDLANQTLDVQWTDRHANMLLPKYTISCPRNYIRSLQLLKTVAHPKGVWHKRDKQRRRNLVFIIGNNHKDLELIM